MPFLGKDWRSSGDQWIRTEHGWERCKALECILDNLSIGLRKEKTYKKQRRLNSYSCSDNSSRLNSECDDLDDGKYSENNTLKLPENKESNNDSYNKIEPGDQIERSCNLNNEYFENESLENNEHDEIDDNDLNNIYLADFDTSSDEDNKNDSSQQDKKLKKKNYKSLSRLCLSNGSVERYNYKTKQPHIIFYDFEGTNRENNAPKHSISDVLTALDMPGAVRDIKRFNYVCRLVQIIINEKLHHLSGNAQRTLFMIVKQMLIQVIKTQENLNVMRKLLFDFKKKIQDSYYYYFYYIGSQKLSEKHLATISKWQEMLDNPNHKKVKRLTSHHHFVINMKQPISQTNEDINKENKSASLETIPLDCKIEIMRRLNTGLDLINLSQCNRNLNDIINKEIAIWKNLCQFHFHQTNINALLINKTNKNTNDNNQETMSCSNSKVNSSDLDWKQIYFKLKRRYGHREVYVDMIHKCLYCKCLFWKEIGHPCIINNTSVGTNENDLMDVRTEPITPKKLIDLLLK